MVFIQRQIITGHRAPGQMWKSFLDRKETSKASLPKENGHQGQSKQIYRFFIWFLVFLSLYKFTKSNFLQDYSQKAAIY